MLPWRNPELTLGARCLLLAESERSRGVHAAPYGQPNTGPRVRDYLSPCVRDVDHDGDLDPLGLTAGNWCAAFASFCLYGDDETPGAILPGELPPHHYRAGVVEIIADADSQGRWHPVDEVRAGTWIPGAGDLVIWDRSKDDDPSTAWWRHVNRFVRWTSPERKSFVTIGGNESRTILRDSGPPKGLDANKLLGFVSYGGTGVPRMTDDDRRRTLALVSDFIASALRGEV